MFNNTNSSRIAALSLVMMMVLSVVAAGGALAADVDGTGGDWAGDGTDAVLEFNADEDENSTVNILTSDTGADVTVVESMTLEIGYENNTHATEEFVDPVSTDDGVTETADTEAHEFLFTVDHDDLETLPGEPEETTTVNVTITEVYEDVDDPDADEDGMVTVETEFEVDFTFSDQRSVMFVTDDAVDDDDVGPSVSSESVESGFLGSLAFWSADADHDVYTLDEERIHTENATHYVYMDGDVADAFAASAEDKESGDLLLEQTMLAHSDIAIVFNDELSSDVLDEDDSTYAVYDEDNNMVMLNAGEGLEERSTIDVLGANDNPLEFADRGAIASAYGDELGFVGMVTGFDARTAGISLTGFGLSAMFLIGGMKGVRRFRAEA